MKHLFFISILLAMLVSCGQNGQNEKKPNTVADANVRSSENAVYYWKTTFKISDEERRFLSNHDVKRLYLRYFDVYRDADFPDRAVPVPEATLKFIDTVPANLEIVPVVFIDNNLFKDCDMKSIADMLVKRIATMTQTHHVPNVREIQLDCDWTQITEAAYFEFLQEIHKSMKTYKYGLSGSYTADSVMLSATIRLHQLTMKVPPIDRGVLMCYNTGGIRNPKTDNSILAASDVALYAKNIKNYALPLDVAYPTFSWAVWFRGEQFQSLLRSLNPENENLTRKKDNRYTVKNGFYQEGKYLQAGDEIRFETSTLDEILKAKQLTESQLTDYSVILYHLDNNNLSKYTSDEINQIFAR